MPARTCQGQESCFERGIFYQCLDCSFTRESSWSLQGDLLHKVHYLAFVMTQSFMARCLLYELPQKDLLLAGSIGE